MIIEKIHVWSHGKLNDLELTLTSSLNVIYGENEAGKSTLQNFILGMLYGPLKHELKRKKYEDEILIKKPWGDGRWGGIIRFRLDNGKIYEVVRDFDKNTVNIYDEFGNDITNEFGRMKNGDSNFAEELLRVDKDIFRNTVFISQNMVDSLSNRKSLRNRIQAIVSTGSEDVSSKFALEKLENALNKIGTPNAMSKPLGSYVYKLRKLENELEEMKNTFKEILERVEELPKLNSVLTELIGEEKNLEYAELIINKNEWEEKIKKIEDTQKKIDELTEVIKEKKIREIDEEDYQTAVALNTKRSELSGQLKRLKAELSKYENEKKKIEGSLPVYADEAGEFIERLEEMDKKLQIEKGSLESIKNQLEALLNDKEEISKILSDLSQFETVSEKDLDEIRESKTRRQYYEEWIEAKKEKIETNRLQIELFEKNRRSKRRNSILLSILGILMGISPAFGAPPILVLIGGFLIIISLLYLKSAPKIEEIDNLKEKVNNLQKELESKSFKDSSNELLQRFGVRDENEFLEKYRKFESASEKLNSINQDIEKLQKRRNEIIETINSHIQSVKDVLSPLGLEVDDLRDESDVEEKIEKITISIERAIKELNYILEAKRSIESIRSQITKLEEDIKSVEINLREVESELSKILEKYSVTSFEDLKEAYSEYINAREEISKLNKLEAEKSALLGDKSLEDYKKELEKLKNEIERVKGDSTYVGLSKEEVKARLKEVREKITQLRDQIKMNEGRIETLEKHYRPIQEIEEEIAELKEKVNELKMYREALEIAKETLIEAERDFTKDFVRILNEKISSVVKILTAKYTDVRVDDDLNVNVRDPEYKKFAKCEYLSRGTIDQIYFILKVAIAEMLTKDYERLPLILDDVFANYDSHRLENALNFLVELAKRYQIIFFTCHKELVDKLEEIVTNKGFGMSSSEVCEFIVLRVPSDHELMES